MEWQNMFPEKNQKCCFPLLGAFTGSGNGWYDQGTKLVRDVTHKISKLITYSPKWNTVSDELKERIAPDTPWFCVLCPTRWTVHAKSLKSVEDNYAILQKRVVAVTTKQCLESSLLPIYSKHMQLLQYTSVHTDINVLVFVLLLLLLAQSPPSAGFPDLACRWQTLVWLTTVCACQLVGRRHLIGDAELFHTWIHHQSPAPCTVAWSPSKQSACMLV